MTKVMGINKKNKVKTIKVENMRKREIEKMLKEKGWTNIAFFKE